MIETVCNRGHVEHVQPAPEGVPFYPYIGAAVCQREFKDGTVCQSPIVNTFRFEEDEAVRPGPDDSVAPGVLERLAATVAPEIGAAFSTGDRHFDPWGLPTPASSWAGLGLIALSSLAVLSLAATLYLAATGRWLLALLV